MHYGFRGFLAPVANLPVLNSVTAGRTVSIKWRLQRADGSYVSDLRSFVSMLSTSVACNASPSNVVNQQFVGAGDVTVRYDATDNNFVVDWRTNRAWNGCRMLKLKLTDGTSHFAKFGFK